MPTPTRPTDYPQWTQGNNAQRLQPSAPEQFSGYSPNQRPGPLKMNWLFGIISDWIAWFDYAIQSGIAALRGYDAVVGINGTHATINDLMSDSNILPGMRILVTSPQTLTATQVISKNDLAFDFKPSAVYSKGGATTPGISITANRVRLIGGRFTDFAGVSDKAIQLESGSRNCLIAEAYFNNNTTTVNDIAGSAGNNLIANCIEEI